MPDAPQRATCLALQAETGPIRAAQWRETHVQEDTISVVENGDAHQAADRSALWGTSVLGLLAVLRNHSLRNPS